MVCRYKPDNVLVSDPRAKCLPFGCLGNKADVCKLLLRRYKPDNVLVSDPLANASRFVALVARKLTRDGKNQSGAGIDLHALLQVTVLHYMCNESRILLTVLSAAVSGGCAALHCVCNLKCY